MSDYSVDDILLEVQHKKSPAPPKTGTMAFTPIEKADGFAALSHGVGPKADGATRVDLPAMKAQLAEPEAKISEKKAVPIITAEEEELTARRQAQVSNFMKTSFAAQNTSFEDDDDDEDDQLDLSAFFDKKRAEMTRTMSIDPSLLLEEDEDEEEEERRPLSALFSRKKGEREEKRPREDRKNNRRREEPEEEETAGEYRSAADIPAVLAEIDGLKRALKVRLIAVGVFTVLGLYLSLCNLFPLPLFAPVCPENNMTAFLLCCFVPLVGAVAVSVPVIANGLAGLFSGRPGHDTPAALCVLAVMAHTVALMAGGKLAVGSGGFYVFTAELTLLANTLGKLIMVKRIEKNFAVISSADNVSGEVLMADNPLADRLLSGQGFDDAAVTCAVPANFAEGFLKHSYSKDFSEELCRITTPLLLGFGAMSSLLAWIAFDQGAVGGLGVFCVMMCMSSALSETLASNLPLYRAAQVLSASGALIAGYGAVDEFEDANAVAVDAAELYPRQKAVLHGIRAFKQERIDEAIVDAASVMTEANGTLSDVFVGVIGGNTAMLKPVTNLVCEPGYGLSARVDGKIVLIGSRELLSRRGLPAPDLDYEEKFTKDGKSVLYLANSGEVTAMFVVSYNPDDDARRALRDFARCELSLVVRSTDPNITAKRIAEDFGYPEEYLCMVGEKEEREFAAFVAERESVPAQVVTTIGGRLKALSVLNSLSSSVKLATFIQVAGLVLGYAVTALLAFFGKIDALGFTELLCYQAFWAALVVGVPALRKF